MKFLVQVSEYGLNYFCYFNIICNLINIVDFQSEITGTTFSVLTYWGDLEA